MTEPAAPVTPPPTGQPSFLGIGLGTLLTSAMGLLGSVVGAGPWGLAGGAIAGLLAFFGIRALIKRWNAGVDTKDLARAGADAGETAVDLSDQLKNAQDGLARMREAIPAVDESSKGKS